MDETPSILETFDIKYTGLRGRENARVDVRVKFAGHKATAACKERRSQDCCL